MFRPAAMARLGERGFTFFGPSATRISPRALATQTCSSRPGLEVTLPVAGSSSVDVNLGNTETNFITAAYEQIANGTVPSAAIVNAQLANFTNNPTYWRRVDTVNSFLNTANKNNTKLYSDPWLSDTPFTSVPCKNVTRDIGAVCMFFFGCEGGVNCQMDWANTHANGMNIAASILGFGSSPTGIYNSSVNPGFWYRELLDARYAGLQFLMPNVYGPDLGNNNISNLATALANIAGQGLASQVKIAMFDDTSGWNTGNPAPFNSIPSFSNPAASRPCASIFNNKWKPFFTGIPSTYWYTIGGRPVIYFYNAGTLTPLNQSAATIAQLKALFNTQFGVTPYVVVDRAYFADPAMQNAGNADNEFVWDTLHSALPNNLSSYNFSGVRWDSAMVKWDPLGRNYYGAGAPNIHIAGGGDGLIKDDSYLVPALANSGPTGDNANVLVIGTWNDLGEGTGINRNYDYYWGGNWQPPNVFMNDIRASQSQQSCGTILPTIAPTPVQTPLVTDFETINASNKLTEWNAGNILTVKDTLGSTMTQTPWTYASCVAGNGSTHAGRISGNLIAQNTGTGIYPFAYLALELTPNGSVPSNANVSVVPESPNQGLQFDFKAGAAGVQYRVDLVEHDGATTFNYTYFQFVFTAPDTAWHTVDVYFPGVSGGGFRFSRPGGGTFDPTVLGAVLFQVQPQNGLAVNYDLTVDNVTFAVPPPPPATGGPLICLQTSTATTPRSGQCQDRVEQRPHYDGQGQLRHDHAAESLDLAHRDRGGESGRGRPHQRHAGLQQITTTAQYPFAFLGLELTPNGSVPANANVNVLPYAPNQGLEFDYKAGAAGVQYPRGPGGARRGHHLRLQLLPVRAGPRRTRPGTRSTCISPTWWAEPCISAVRAGASSIPRCWGAVLFQVQAQNGVTVPYDLTVDNVSFNCPAPPTPTPTPTPSSGRHAFTRRPARARDGHEDAEPNAPRLRRVNYVVPGNQDLDPFQHAFAAYGDEQPLLHGRPNQDPDAIQHRRAHGHRQPHLRLGVHQGPPRPPARPFRPRPRAAPAPRWRPPLTSTPTSTVAVPPTATGSPSSTLAATKTSTPTSTAVPPTATGSPSSTLAATKTSTPTSTAVPPTATRSNTPYQSATASPAGTLTPTPVQSSTSSFTPSPAPTKTGTPTSTAVPPTATMTSTATCHTATGTPTSTAVPPTATRTSTPLQTATASPLGTLTPTPVQTATAQPHGLHGPPPALSPPARRPPRPPPDRYPRPRPPPRW